MSHRDLCATSRANESSNQPSFFIRSIKACIVSFSSKNASVSDGIAFQKRRRGGFEVINFKKTKVYFSIQVWQLFRKLLRRRARHREKRKFRWKFKCQEMTFCGLDKVLDVGGNNSFGWRCNEQQIDSLTEHFQKRNTKHQYDLKPKPVVVVVCKPFRTERSRPWHLPVSDGDHTRSLSFDYG